MLKLHASPISSNSRKVRWALEELGVPYTYHHVDLMKGEQKAEGHTALNPNAKVPVIEDDGIKLWESNAILWYLGDRYGTGKLVPTDAHERALVHQWVAWQGSEIGPTVIRPWLMQLMAKFGAPMDKEEHGRLCAAAKTPLAVLDGQLARHAYVTGTRLTIADIAIAESVGLCEEAGISLEEYPNVRRWFASMGDRPAFVKTRANMG